MKLVGRHCSIGEDAILVSENRVSDAFALPDMAISGIVRFGD